MSRNCEKKNLVFKPAELDFLRMKEKIKPFVPEGNVVLIKKISDVLGFPPFTQLNNPEKPPLGETKKGKKPTIFCDFDGVISSPGRTDDENLAVLFTLKRIIIESSSFILWSSRINVDDDNPFFQSPFNIFAGKISNFPFFTDSSLRRLYCFLNRIAGNKDDERRAEIGFKIGIKKILNEDGFLKSALQSLENGPLVIIGSSYFDRRRIEGLVEKAVKRGIPLNDLYYFDTGHLVL